MQLLSPAQALVARIHAGWNLGNTLDALRRNVQPGEIVPPPALRCDKITPSGKVRR